MTLYQSVQPTIYGDLVAIIEADTSDGLVEEQKRVIREDLAEAGLPAGVLIGDPEISEADPFMVNEHRSQGKPLINAHGEVVPWPGEEAA